MIINKGYPMTASEIVNHLTTMLENWTHAVSNFVVHKYKGLHSVCKGDAQIRVRLTLQPSENTELNQNAIDSLKTRSVYLPTSMDGAGSEIYRITLMADNPSSSVNGTYYILLSAADRNQAGIEKAFHEVKNFLAYEIFHDQSLASATVMPGSKVEDGKGPSTSVDYIKKNLATIGEKLDALSKEVKFQFPSLEQNLVAFIRDTDTYLHNRNYGVMGSLSSREEMLLQGAFIRGYIHQASIDTVIEVSEINQAVSAIVNHVRQT